MTLYHMLNPNVRHLSMKKRQLARDAMKMIHRWKTKDIADLSAAEVARRLGVTQQYLARCFNNYYLGNLREYIHRQKMYSAYILLESQEYNSIQEILDAMDIRSHSHFVQCFKKFDAYNQTPGQYKREYQKKWKEMARKFREKYGNILDE